VFILVYFKQKWQNASFLTRFLGSVLLSFQRFPALPLAAVQQPVTAGITAHHPTLHKAVCSG
jgi:hypothetical protein